MNSFLFSLSLLQVAFSAHTFSYSSLAQPFATAFPISLVVSGAFPLFLTLFVAFFFF
jgi:hypothetical protein